MRCRVGHIHRPARVDRDARRVRRTPACIRPRATTRRARAPLPGANGLDAVVDGVGRPAAGRSGSTASPRGATRPCSARGGADRAQVGAVGVEHLHAVVGGVGDVRVARRIAGERARERELAGLRAEAAPCADERRAAGLSLTTRWLMSSATYTSPAASRATP